MAAYPIRSFEVGDLVVGRDVASERYRITKSGTIWAVIEVFDDEMIKVAGLEEFGGGGNWIVNKKYFEYAGGQVE